MFKQAKTSNKHSPPRNGQPVGHLEETPPVTRKCREIRFNNENRNCTNVGRLKAPDEFECSEDYVGHKGSFECQDYVKRSINIQPASLSQSQDNWTKLTHSQENILRKPRVADRSGVQPNSSLTFGSMRQGILKNSLATNRQFLEEKKIKNEILDEIIKNASKNNLKSQEILNRKKSSQEYYPCVNHENKKGKYRAVGDTEQVFYCSKCSISLLQQGYNVEQVGPTGQPINQNKKEQAKRKKELEALLQRVIMEQTKLTKFVDSMGQQECGYDFQGARAWLEEIYEVIGMTLEQMRIKDIQGLKDMEQQTILRRKKDKGKLQDKISRLDSIKDDLEQLIRSDLTELSESQMNATMESYSSSLKAVETYEPESVCIKIQTIDEKLERMVVEIKENFQNKSESESAIQYRDESSIISKLDEKLADMIPDAQTRNPFRNLFTQDEQSSGFNKQNSRYVEEQFETKHFSPKFKRLY